MKYLITDPCYIIGDKRWTELGEKYSWGKDFVHNLREGDNGEKIIVAFKTMYGDGSQAFDEGVVGVDAGLVCLAEVSDDYNLDSFLGAVTSDYRRAKEIFAEALKI